MKTRSSLCLLATLAALALATGCTTPVKPVGVLRDFEFPFVNDYSVVNHVSFRWSDTFLTNRCDAYHQELAGPLAALAASAYGYRMYMDSRTLYALGFAPEDMYRRYGFDLDYTDPKYGRDQVGFTLAAKKIPLDGSVRDVLFVIVRGTFGKNEWLSNLNPCNSWGRAVDPDPAKIPPFHEGFRLAADAVEEALVAYAASNRLDLANAKVVLTGHSRGAAVANILGARLDDYAANGSSSPLAAIRHDNLFVYTFATPNTIINSGVNTTAARYANIFNVINPEDVVPLVPVAKWDYRRFGRDLQLLCYDDLSIWSVWWGDAYNSMKDHFKAMTGYEWWHMPFGTKATHVLPSLIGALAPTLGDLYTVPPELREAGTATSIHSILEYTICQTMEDPVTEERAISLGGDIAKIAKTYSTINNPKSGSADEYIAQPDGHDFERQPEWLNIPWRITCMHAPGTYIGWMKAAEECGPEEVYRNPPPQP